MFLIKYIPIVAIILEIILRSHKHFDWITHFVFP
jgi:hypothetical protein